MTDRNIIIDDDLNTDNVPIPHVPSVFPTAITPYDIAYVAPNFEAAYRALNHASAHMLFDPEHTIALKDTYDPITGAVIVRNITTGTYTAVWLCADTCYSPRESVLSHDLEPVINEIRDIRATLKQAHEQGTLGEQKLLRPIGLLPMV